VNGIIFIAMSSESQRILQPGYHEQRSKENGWFSTFLTRTFTYDSPKVVSMRSVRLGLFSWVSGFLVFAYIVLWSCMYKNRHYQKSRPVGLGRLQLQRPTLDHCNPMHAGCKSEFTPMEELPYCLNYKGDKKYEGTKRKCRYMDEKEMNPSGKQHYHMLVPTRITTIDQVKTKNCEDNKCDNIFEHHDKEDLKPSYIADLDRFTLLIDHAFILPFEDQVQGAPIRRGSSSKFQGYFEVCDDPRKQTGCTDVPIPCFSGCDGKPAGRRLADADLLEGREEGMPNLRRLAESDDPNFFSIKVGDIIPIGDLMRLAGVDLNNATNSYGESRRSEGFVVQIDIDFRNSNPFHWPPWESPPIIYVYRVGLLPIETYKETSQTLNDKGDKRSLDDWHGIFIKVTLGGSINYFYWPQLLIVLTTSVTLLATADSVLHFYASKIWAHKDEYTLYKYDKTVNLNVGEPLLGEKYNPHHEHELKTWQLYTEDHMVAEEMKEKCSSKGEEFDFVTFANSMQAKKEDGRKFLDFTSDVRGLDGEALGAAADMIMELWKISEPLHKDRIASHVTMAEYTRTESRRRISIAPAGGSSQALDNTTGQQRETAMEQGDENSYVGLLPAE